LLSKADEGFRKPRFTLVCEAQAHTGSYAAVGRGPNILKGTVTCLGWQWRIHWEPKYRTL